MTKKETPPIKLMRASSAYVEKLKKRADAHHGPYPLWHGWAIREAFIAGTKWKKR